MISDSVMKNLIKNNQDPSLDEKVNEHRDLCQKLKSIKLKFDNLLLKDDSSTLSKKNKKMIGPISILGIVAVTCILCCSIFLRIVFY